MATRPSSDDALKVYLQRSQQNFRLNVMQMQDDMNRIGGMKLVLRMRSDLVKDQMKTFFTNLQLQLQKFSQQFQSNIDDFVSLKEEELDNKSGKLQEYVKLGVENAMKIDAMLQDSVQLRTCGRGMLQTCEDFFNMEIPSVEADDFGYFSYVPLIEAILNWEDIGYMKYCNLSPFDIDVVSNVSTSNVMTAYRGKIENILIHTNLGRYRPEILNHLTVQILDPTNSCLPVTIEDNKDGSYFAVYTPQTEGRHILHVKLYGVPVKESPFEVEVMARDEPVEILHSESSEFTGSVGNPNKGHCSLPAWQADLGSFPKPDGFFDTQKLTDVKESKFCTSENFDWGKPNLVKPDSFAVKGNLGESDEMISSKVDFNSSSMWCPPVTKKEPSGYGDESKKLLSPMKGSSIWCPPVIKKEPTGYGDGIHESPAPRKQDPWKFQESSTPTKIRSNGLKNRAVDTNLSETAALPRSTSKWRSDSNDEMVSMITDLSVNGKKRGRGLLQQYIDSKQQIVKTEFLTEIGKPGNSDDCLFLPIGVTVNNRGQTIVCDTRHNAVKVFDKTGALQVLIKNQVNFLRPSAVVVNKDDEMFIKDDACIHVFNSDGRFVRSIGQGKLERPYGLAMTENSNLLLFDHGRRQPNLWVFSQDGNVLSHNPFKPLMGPAGTSGSKCRFLECVGQSAYVVDLGKSMVYVSDFDGNPIHTFGSYGRKLGEFNEPSGITSDADGNLLIADSRNNRIQMFTPDGVVQGIVELAVPITRPSDICLTSDGKLYVSNYLKHCIKVFKILPLK